MKTYNKLCVFCKQKFISHRCDKRFCKPRCRKLYWKLNKDK